MSVINTNVNAVLAQNALVKNERSMSSAMEQLSTGKRINGAKDDAAGMAIASKMTSQIRGLDQATRNVNDAISMIQTAEGATVEITNMLQRMRELAVQSSSGSNTADDRANIEAEFNALRTGIENVANTTQWNGESLLEGSKSGVNATVFQIGANNQQTMTVDMQDLNLAGFVAGVAGTNYLRTDNTDIQALTSMKVGDITVNSQALLDATDHATLRDALNADTDYNQRYTASVQNELVVTTSAGEIATQANIIISGESSGNATYTISSASTVADVVSQLNANSTFKTYFVARVGGDNQDSTTSYTIRRLSGGTAPAAANVAHNSSSGALATTSDADKVSVVSTEKAGYETAAGPTSSVQGSVSNTVITKTGGTAAKLGLGADISALTSTTSGVITTLDNALRAISIHRGNYGAAINRLEYTADNLANVSTNTQASRSRIEDADYAKATTELARTQIIQQAGTAMLAQANQQSQGVLALLQ